MTTAVIVGANLAGGRAAETLRQAGYEGRIVLIGGEPDRPYERPPLSKEYLAGKADEEKLYLRPLDYYAEHEIELRLGVRATTLDPAGRSLMLADGELLDYDNLLICTGAAPRPIEAPGADLPGILYLRTLRDAEYLRGRKEHARRVVVVGAGFIGAEVAATCRQAGLEVILLEALPVPLERGLGRRVGEIYARIHRDRGVDLRTNAAVAAFRGHGLVEQVVTASGEAFECDFVVVGVGVAPEVGWLAGSGLQIENGILVDEFCRTNLPGVYAAGDVANWWHPTLGQRLRVEHYDNAQNQGVAAAKSMLGQGEPYAPVPFFWSDQYDLNLQYVGHARGDDEVVLRGDPSGESWSAFYLREGRVQAALAVNRFRDVSAARQLIAKRVPITPAQIADEGTDLRALARQAGQAPI
ncbi:MAG TPA: FAD-dependent oxidoreductase [Dehalococcoidia bacterium]|nr:FAD-dependent oxidoreductase [Dehalococcoidia bacterium]